MVVHGGDHTVTVNGGANQTISAGSLQTVTYSNSGNATFIMTFHRGGGADTGVRAIQINGVILTDPLKRFGDAAATNFNPFITDINAVRGQETGYCTMNPLDQKFTDNGTISNGNLDYSQSSTGARAARCTIGVSSGKWYWEFTHLGGNNSHGIQKGLLRILVLILEEVMMMESHGLLEETFIEMDLHQLILVRHMQ